VYINGEGFTAAEDRVECVIIPIRTQINNFAFENMLGVEDRPNIKHIYRLLAEMSEMFYGTTCNKTIAKDE
jgi:hypothetical protein